MLIVFPIILLGSGLFFAGMGGYHAWTADSMEESGKNLRLVGFGGALILLGIIGFFVVNAIEGDDEPETATPIAQEQTAPVETGAVATETGADTTATETGTVALTEEQTDSGAVIIETGTDATETGYTIIADSSHSPHNIGSGNVIVGTPVEETATPTGSATTSPLVTPHAGEITFSGISYSRDGRPITDMFVDEEFQINVKVTNGDYFIWDTDTDVDSDQDGVSDNDFDLLVEDPIVSFPAPGKYELNLTVVNSDTVANKTYKITVQEKEPEVLFTVTPDEQYPAKIFLDATPTKFYSTGARQFVWEIDDEEVELEDPAADNQSGWYTLPAVGVYDITCHALVADDGTTSSYLSNKDGTKYSISESQEFDLESILSAEIISSEQIAVAPATVTFTAHAGDYSSTGLDESVITKYVWDFDDDSTLKSGQQKSITHTFDEPGIYDVRLTVTDKKGNSATDSTLVFISDAGSPVAYFTPEPATGHRGQVFTFDAGESRRSDGSDDHMTFSWDFGDGSDLVSGRRVTHKFDELGEYQVRLSATDQSGDEYDGYYDSHTATVTIAPAAPTAAFNAEKIHNLEYEFDAQNSTDPDDNIIKYQWDFGDGNNAMTTAPTVRHIFDTAGTYEVYLLVRDEDGLTGERTLEVQVK